MRPRTGSKTSEGTGTSRPQTSQTRCTTLAAGAELVEGGAMGQVGVAHEPQLFEHDEAAVDAAHVDVGDRGRQLFGGHRPIEGIEGLEHPAAGVPEPPALRGAGCGRAPPRRLSSSAARRFPSQAPLLSDRAPAVPTPAAPGVDHHLRRHRPRRHPRATAGRRARAASRCGGRSARSWRAPPRRRTGGGP